MTGENKESYPNEVYPQTIFKKRIHIPACWRKFAQQGEWQKLTAAQMQEVQVWRDWIPGTNAQKVPFLTVCGKGEGVDNAPFLTVLPSPARNLT